MLIGDFKKKLANSFGNFLLKAPGQVVDFESSFLLVWADDDGSPFSFVYAGIYKDVQFQIGFMLKLESDEKRKKFVEAFNVVATSFAIDSKHFASKILDYQEGAIKVSAPASQEKSPTGLTVQRKLFSEKDIPTPVASTAQEERGSPWLLIIAGAVMATLAGVGLFWLLKRPSGT